MEGLRTLSFKCLQDRFEFLGVDISCRYRRGIGWEANLPDLSVLVDLCLHLLEDDWVDHTESLWLLQV